MTANDLAAESSHPGALPESAVQQPMQQPRRPQAPVGTVRRPLTCANDPWRPSCNEFTPRGLQATARPGGQPNMRHKAPTLFGAMHQPVSRRNLIRMETGVWVALIASATSVIVAGFSLYFQRKSIKEERAEKQRSDAKVVLDKYRGPLLVAASDLGQRLNNIRHDEFLVYATPGMERERQAKLTTLFRFAQYFGWCEILRTEAQLLRFEHEADTQLAAALIGDIHWAFATDKVNDGVHGMLWAEEQRGIGELMVLRNGESSSTSYGYVRFVREYDERFAAWMDRIADLALGEEAIDSHRLRLVQWGLLGLVKQLDEEHAHTGEKWMDQARKELKKNPEPGAPRVESSIRNHMAEAVQQPVQQHRRPAVASGARL